MAVKCVSTHFFSPKGVQFVDSRKAAAENDGIRVEYGNQPAQGASEIIYELKQDFTAAGVPVSVSPNDFLHFQALVEPAEKSLFHSGAADLGLDAAAVPTVAGNAGRIDGYMPPFTANAVPAVVNRSVDADAPAAAGAHDDAEHGAISPGGAVSAFGKRKAVGVVGQADGPAEGGLDVAFQRACR